MIKTNKTFENESKNIISEYNSDKRDMLEEGAQYKVIMTNHSCEDKGAMKNEELIKLAESKYKGSIQKTCDTCKKKIEPKLVFAHIPSQIDLTFPFFTLYHSYLNLRNIFIILMKNDSSVKEKDYEDYNKIIGNIIYYLDLKKGEVTNISKYLASCVY